MIPEHQSPGFCAKAVVGYGVPESSPQKSQIKILQYPVCHLMPIITCPSQVEVKTKPVAFGGGVAMIPTETT